MASTSATPKNALHLAGILLITLTLPATTHATSLQLYGTLDGGFYSHSSKTQGHFIHPGTSQSTPFSIRSQNSGIGSGLKDESKIGLRGSHNIGGGNRIFFELEEEIDIATGHRSRDRGTRVIGIGG
ncbi:porin [Advenella sp. WQ 585]|uniref:Porin n=1 Tax=Advenella mandrilli TaxID=2800330 RepID=A0ABS1EFI0_9BURK|nr:porin [Advenella mandrilli]MBK1780912.1 porin [Advenella mandrilli]